MNDESALLRAICENPEDDTARLVFADYLQEQGGAVNTAWALALRAQLAMAGGATDTVTLQRARVLDLPFGRDRVRERLGYSPRLNVTEWDRGFPAAVVNEFDALAEEWPRVAWRVPIRRVHCYELSAPQAAELVTWPGLVCLRGLSFALAGDDLSAVLTALAGCAAFERLQALSVRNATPADADAVTLLDSPHLTGLKVLDMGYGWQGELLGPGLEARLVARFGLNVIDRIPF